MRRDRLETLVHIRELVERRRQAEQATARIELEAAEMARIAARAALAGASLLPAVAVAPAALASHRASGVALGEAVESTTRYATTAARRHTTAEQRWSEAAKDRKAAERLAERRAEVVAIERDKRDRQRMDELALTVWRRAR